MSYEKFKKDIEQMMERINIARENGKIEPTVGDHETALENDPAIDPEIGDVNACVCFDDLGNPINKCNECPR